jgi:hypothetical protein
MPQALVHLANPCLSFAMTNSPFNRLWPIAVTTTAWCAFFGATLWALGSDRSLLASLLCLLPAAAAAGLGFTSQQDRGQYLARLLACAAFLPLLLLMLAYAEGGGVWQASGLLLAALLAVWLLAFLGGVVAMASSSTAIAAAPGIEPVAAERLGTRLLSLAALSLPLRLGAKVQRGTQPGQWELELRDPAMPERLHRVRLDIDAAAHHVVVRERLLSTGAVPSSADDASMRSVGDPAFEPARPQAQWLGARTAQATIVEPDELASVKLQWGFDGGVAAVVLPPVMRDGSDDGLRDAAGSQERQPQHPDGALRDEAQAWLTLLAAVVTRSGYAWRPTLF